MNTTGIYEPVSVTYVGQKLIEETIDLDEYELGSDAISFEITIKNNSEFPITDLDLEFVGQSENQIIVNYMTDDEEENKFPGQLGTCGNQLLPTQTCTIHLMVFAEPEVNPKLLLQKVRVHYKNLIEKSHKDFFVKVNVGYAASLVFVGESGSDFWFGDKVTLRQVPVVERSVPRIYTKEFTITNTGDLRARDVALSISDLKCEGVIAQVNCSALDATFNNTYLNSAWSIEHNCPAILRKGETCRMTVNFEVKNQDTGDAGVDQVLTELKYSVTNSINYKANPALEEKGLSAFYTTTSTDIAAYFETTVDQILIEEPLIAGNRDFRLFRITNRGYAAGIIHKMYIYPNNLASYLTPPATPMAVCVADGQSGIYLTCYTDDTLSTKKTLLDFPFLIEDTESCISPSGVSNLVAPDVSCLFKITVQPSIDMLNETEYAMSLWLHYDRRLREEVTLKTTNMFESFSIIAQTAARLSLTNVNYLGANEVVEKYPENLVGFDREQSFDMGRLALLLPQFAQYHELTFEFRNIGQATATNIKGYFGEDNSVGTSIPLDTGGIAGLDVGTNATYPFYKGLKLSNSCLSVPAGGACNITMQFAPLALGSTCDENSSMFDFQTCSETISERLTFYKKFYLTYDDATLYDDTRLESTDKNIPDRVSQAKLHAILVKKGYLQPYHEQQVPSMGVFGLKLNYFLKFTNIGSGGIPYISAANGDYFDPAITKGLYLVDATNDDIANETAHFDCLDIFDFGASSSSYADIDTRKVVTVADENNINQRKNTWLDGGLPSGQSCILKFEINPQSIFTLDQTVAASSSGSGFHTLPFADFDSTNSTSNWANYNVLLAGSASLVTTPDETELNLFYYDGDVQTTTPTDDIVDHFGFKFDNTNSLLMPIDMPITFSPPSDITFSTFKPSQTATVYDKEFFTDTIGANAQFSSFDSLMYSGTQVSGFNTNGAPSLFTPKDKTVARVLASYTGDLDHTPGSRTIVLGTFNEGESVYADLNVIPTAGGVYAVKDSEVFTSSDGCMTLVENVLPASAPGAVGPFLVEEGSNLNVIVTAPTNLPFINGLYKCEATYSIQFHDNVYDQVGPYDPENPLNNFDAQRINTKSVKLVAWIEEGNVPFSLKIQEFQVSAAPPQDPMPPATEVLQATTETLDYEYMDNRLEGDNLKRISLEAVTIKDTSVTSFDDTLYYVKKRVTLENTSSHLYGAGGRLLGFRWKYGLGQEKDFSTVGDYIQLHLTNPDDPADSNYCGHSSIGMTKEKVGFNSADLPVDNRFPNGFSPNSSCHFDLVYQPRLLPTGKRAVDRFTLIIDYATKTSDIASQSVDIAFTEVSPANVIPENLTKSGLSYLMEFPEQELVENLNFEYEVTLRNTVETKASFVHQWITFKGLNLTDGSNNPILPDFASCSGVDEDVDCINRNSEVFRLVSDVDAMDGDIKIGQSKAFLNEACFVGDDDPADNWSQKGFSNNSSAPCVMFTQYIPNINSYKPASSMGTINVYLLSNSKFELTYYDYNRGSTKTLYFAYDGNILPSPSDFDISAGNSEIYDSVVATPGKEVSFDWNAFIPHNSAAFGDIVGYRVFLSETTQPLNNLYLLADPSSRTYIDIRSTGALINFNDFMNSNFKYYHFKVAAIRYSADYEHTWKDLNVGEYLSYDESLTPLSIVTPGIGYKYAHKGNRLYRTENEPWASKNEDNTFYLRKSVCEGIFQISVSQADLGLFSKKLIDIQGRDFLIDNPDYNCEGGSCFNFGDEAVWLDAPLMSVSQYGFSSMNGWQDPPQPIPITADRSLYIDIDPLQLPHSYFVGEGAVDSVSILMNKPLAQIYGRFLVNDQPPGVYGLLDTEIPLATSRCYVDLDDRLN